MIKKFFMTALIFTLITFAGCADSKEVPVQVEKVPTQETETVTTNIKIIVNGKTFDEVLEDNESARKFLEKLPLEVTMTELNGNEKYYRFNENLPSADERVGMIHAGDLMLYSSSYVVIFYEDFSTSYSYTRLGKILNVDEFDKILGNGDVTVKFER
ncbi:MAG: hypothetical protein IKZ58_03925 [Selenomonadaceae bacterium]|nr:hypothetical protein [Selenomonadaceae bacterium]